MFECKEKDGTVYIRKITEKGKTIMLALDHVDFFELCESIIPTARTLHLQNGDKYFMPAIAPIGSENGTYYMSMDCYIFFVSRQENEYLSDMLREEELVALTNLIGFAGSRRDLELAIRAAHRRGLNGIAKLGERVLEKGGQK